MQKIKLLLIALVSLFVANAAYSQDEYTKLAPSFAQDGKTILFYSQVRQEVNGDEHKHIIHFVRNKDCKDVVYIQHVRCNEAPQEGWTKIGPNHAQAWIFTYTDDQEDGKWTWEYTVIEKSNHSPAPNTDTLFPQ